jgi:hypothetical protein
MAVKVTLKPSDRAVPAVSTPSVVVVVVALELLGTCGFGSHV